MGAASGVGPARCAAATSRHLASHPAGVAPQAATIAIVTPSEGNIAPDSAAASTVSSTPARRASSAAGTSPAASRIALIAAANSISGSG
ncbi:hypothetical protein [Embleya sp. NPDC005575]|uniref:hypothetical protein n=1 Tax=Embleya sp. NPDC005575 TaxID=3156892 RepID=UPI0033A988EB